MAAREPRFALHPATISDEVLDYSTTEGIKIYKTNTASLPIKYDLSTGKLRLFLETLRNRANTAGWVPILSFTINQREHNLLDEYGMISKETVRTDTLGYATEQNRDAQNSAQLFVCLMNSLTEEAIQTVTIDHNEYTIDEFQDGPLFLKHIITKSHIDTNATISTVRLRLDNLDAHMQKVDSNIKEFNHYVKEQIDALASRGQTPEASTLLFNIMKGYLAADDKEFHSYVLRKQQDYDEGDNITPERLMELGENMYNKSMELDKWKTETDEQKRIVALTAKVEGLEKSNKALKKKVKAKLRKDGTTQQVTGTTKKNHEQGEDKDTKKKNIPKWKLVKPTDGKLTMTRNGKQYHWCPNHNMWCVHKPTECNLKDNNNKSNQGDQNTLRVAKTLAAILDSDDEE